MFVSIGSSVFWSKDHSKGLSRYLFGAWVAPQLDPWCIITRRVHRVYKASRLTRSFTKTNKSRKLAYNGQSDCTVEPLIGIIIMVSYEPYFHLSRKLQC